MSAISHENIRERSGQSGKEGSGGLGVAHAAREGQTRVSPEILRRRLEVRSWTFEQLPFGGS